MKKKFDVLDTLENIKAKMYYYLQSKKTNEEIKKITSENKKSFFDKHSKKIAIASMLFSLLSLF